MHAASATGRATDEIGPRIFVMSGPTLVALDAARRRACARFRPQRRETGCRAVPRHASDLRQPRDRRCVCRRAQSRSCRRYARLRYAHGRARLDVPHRAVAGRSRARNVAGSRLAQSLRDQRLGVLHDARRRERHALHAGVERSRQLLGRRSARRESLQQLHRGGRCADGPVPLALPDRSSRSLGLGHAEPARARRHRARGPSRTRAGVDRQERLRVHPQSRGRQADLRRRGASPCRAATCPTSGIRRLNRFR